MKKIILGFVFCCSLFLGYSQEDNITIPTQIRDVIVYREGALVKRKGKVRLPKGHSKILIKGLTPQLVSSTIRVKAGTDLMIGSVTNKEDYLNELEASEEIQRLQKRKDQKLDSIKILKNELSVYQQEKDLILSNKSLGGNDGVDIENLKKASDFFRTRLLDIETKTNKISKQQIQVKKSAAKIAKALYELNAKQDIPSNILEITVDAKYGRSYELEVEYFVKEASWTPIYDIRIEEINQPLGLNYKAKLVQNTGEKWENVHLVLSTGNPLISNYQPELSPYYLSFNNYYKKKKALSATPINAQQERIIKGIITDEAGEAMIGASVIVKGKGIGTTTEFDGTFQLTIPRGQQYLEISYTGYKSKTVAVTHNNQMNIRLDANDQVLAEIVVTGYGGKNRGYKKQRKKKEEKAIPMAIEKGQVSTEFDIEIPYTIPNDNQEYDVSMVNYNVEAKYFYTAVPKLVEEVFLNAEIPNWREYNLMDGTVHLFFKGSYQGETFLNLEGLQDTLWVSIGRDPEISINRELRKDFSSRQFIGSNQKQKKSWQIDIINNKSLPIRLKLEDQFPISKNKQIKIEQLEHSGGKVGEYDGKITWDLSLSPKSKKELIIEYEVKYPKKQKVIVE